MSEAATTIERLTAERDEARRQWRNYESAAGDTLARALAAESQLALQAEALSKIDLAWTAAVNGNPTKAAEITGWTGSLDNFGEVFAWVARSALPEARD